MTESSRLVAAVGVLAGCAVIALLYFARPVLQPILVAVFLLYALDPIVDRLQRARVPRPVGAVGAVMLVIALATAGFLVLWPQIDIVGINGSDGQQKPSYQTWAGNSLPPPQTELKTLTGRLAYLIGGAQVLLDYEPVPTELIAPPSAGGRSSSLRLHAFAVCNSRLVGGGRLIAPRAVVDDGALDVCLIEAMPTIDFLRLLRRVAVGEHVEDPRVSYFRTPTIELAFARPIAINTDGEALTADRANDSLRPKAARFLADPARAQAFGGG